MRNNMLNKLHIGKWYNVDLQTMALYCKDFTLTIYLQTKCLVKRALKDPLSFDKRFDCRVFKTVHIVYFVKYDDTVSFMTLYPIQ